MYSSRSETTTVLSYRLPKGADVSVSLDQKVETGDVLATAFLSKESMKFPLASILKLSPKKISWTLIKKPGESVTKGDLVCLKKSFFGLFKKKFLSPVDGVIGNLDNETGDLIIKLSPESYPFVTDVSGKVVEVSETNVAVEFKAIEISSETTYGGKKVGKLLTLKIKEDCDPLSVLNDEVKDRTIAVYGDFGRDFLFKAAALGVSAIICDETESETVKEFSSEKKIKVLSKEIEISIPVFVLEEEEGKIGKEHWEALEKHDGKVVILDGDSKKIYLPS